MYEIGTFPRDKMRWKSNSVLVQRGDIDRIVVSKRPRLFRVRQLIDLSVGVVSDLVHLELRHVVIEMKEERLPTSPN